METSAYIVHKVLRWKTILVYALLVAITGMGRPASTKEFTSEPSATQQTAFTQFPSHVMYCIITANHVINTTHHVTCPFIVKNHVGFSSSNVTDHMMCCAVVQWNNVTYNIDFTLINHVINQTDRVTCITNHVGNTTNHVVCYGINATRVFRFGVSDARCIIGQLTSTVDLIKPTGSTNDSSSGIRTSLTRLLPDIVLCTFNMAGDRELDQTTFDQLLSEYTLHEGDLLLKCKELKLKQKPMKTLKIRWRVPNFKEARPKSLTRQYWWRNSKPIQSNFNQLQKRQPLNPMQSDQQYSSQLTNDNQLNDRVHQVKSSVDLYPSKSKSKVLQPTPKLKLYQRNSKLNSKSKQKLKLKSKPKSKPNSKLRLLRHKRDTWNGVSTYDGEVPPYVLNVSYVPTCGPVVEVGELLRKEPYYRGKVLCPSEFLYYEKYHACFLFSRSPLNHSAATSACQNHNSRIISFYTYEKYRCIANSLALSQELLSGWQGWWIGLYFNSVLSEFEWAGDGKVISRGDHRWFPGLILPPYENTCVWMVPLAKFSLGNFGCAQKSGYICEIEL